MAVINLVFPHQLFKDSPLIENGHPVYLVEEFLFFRHYAFHKQKIGFHRASMKFYEDYLKKQGVQVHYINSWEEHADIRRLIPDLLQSAVSQIHYIDVTDNWLEKRIIGSAEKAGIRTTRYESPLFLNSSDELKEFFKPDKKKFFQTSFYKDQRKKRNILMDERQNPVGGKLTFDTENRNKYPKNKVPPPITFPSTDHFYREAVTYTNEKFKNNPGEMAEQPYYPTNFNSARAWFEGFLQSRFAEFGPYEDAIVSSHGILNHSVLSPLLNVGLLSPHEVIHDAMEFSKNNDIPINSLEGFIRQILGWREFIRGIYEVKGTEERTKNFWRFSRKIPASFYNGTTGIDPVDNSIRKVIKTGYCHHIERLMVLGNFMLLCEFDPDEVYRWFMEMFIDAYDWVMVPNVYGMSQFADGGLMSTKPYISSSNYIMKMSDHIKGDWQNVWDALFWRFMNNHRDFFNQNPRLGMLVKTFDKMADDKQKSLLTTAETFLLSLEQR